MSIVSIFPAKMATFGWKVLTLLCALVSLSTVNGGLLQRIARDIGHIGANTGKIEQTFSEATPTNGTGVGQIGIDLGKPFVNKTAAPRNLHQDDQDEVYQYGSPDSASRGQVVVDSDLPAIVIVPHHDIGNIGINKGWIKEHNIKNFGSPGPNDEQHDIGRIGINKGWIKEHNFKHYGGPPPPDYDQEDIGEIGINKGWITEYNRKFFP